MKKKVYWRRPFGVSLKHWLWISGIFAILLSVISIPSNRQISPLNRVDAQAVKAPPQVLVDSGEKLIQKVESLVADFNQTLGGDVSVSFELLDSPYKFDSNQDNVMKSASLYKLFVAHRAFQLIDEGVLNLDMKVNKQHSLKDCLELMITVSDNDCGLKLQKIINPYITNDLLPNMGIENTDISEEYPTTTSEDVSSLLKDIYYGDILTTKSNIALLDLLKSQEINDRLPAWLPKNTIVAHKTGDLNSIIHDAGIIYSPKGPYILSILTRDSELNYRQTYEAFARLSKDIFNLVELEM
jgi:beta-lactamase class A